MPLYPTCPEGQYADALDATSGLHVAQCTEAFTWISVPVDAASITPEQVLVQVAMVGCTAVSCMKGLAIGLMR